MVDRVKLDALEARFLTGLSDSGEAAIEIERWSSRETMITSAKGVADSLRWAATVASIKLEKAGLFIGTREQIRHRMASRYPEGRADS